LLAQVRRTLLRRAAGATSASASFYAGGRYPEALAELVERTRASDPFLGIYLARWGPSVLEDQATLDAILAAYAYLGIPIPNLPEKSPGSFKS